MAKVNKVVSVPEKGRVKIAEKPYPKITNGYVLVKVHVAPICTEQRIYDEHFFEFYEKPDGMGHEGVGEIVEVMPGSQFSVGDRVIIYQLPRCGKCYVCVEAQGTPTSCVMNSPPKLDSAQESSIDGFAMIEEACGSESGGYAFSQYRLAPENMTQRIPDGLSYKYAAAANCLMGCTFTGIRETDVGSGSYMLVAGIGFIGHGLIAWGKYFRAKVIALGRTKNRMEAARKLGADYLINPEYPDWLDQIHAITGSRMGVDVAFECSGFPYYQEKCVQATHNYGRVHLMGYYPKADNMWTFHVDDMIIRRHITIDGHHDVRLKDRRDLVELLQDKEIQNAVDFMVTHEYPMEQTEEAFKTILAKKAIKVYLLPHANSQS